MYVGAPRRQLPRQLLGLWIACLGLLAGCSAGAVTPSVATTTPPATTATPQASLILTPAPSMADSALQPLVPAPITQTTRLAPLTPLASSTIIDRLAQRLRPLTDGQVKYKLAAWSPGAELIAVTPQDGPGLDVVHARTGEVWAMITDTYVLEPVWLDAGVLLVHQASPNGDRLVQVRVDDLQRGAEPVLESREMIHAVGAAGGSLAFAEAEQLQLWSSKPAAPQWIASLEPLVAAPAPMRGTQTVAVTPYVPNLEQVQTVLIQRTPDGLTSHPLSEVGEGMWLPRWAPDSAKLALTTIGGRIISTTADGQQRIDLGPGDLPAWSPDSQRLAFAGTSAGDEFISRDIHVVDWQGQEPRVRLTEANTEQFYTSPTWSPDGTRIAFVEIDTGQLFVVDAPPR